MLWNVATIFVVDFHIGIWLCCTCCIWHTFSVADLPLAHWCLQRGSSDLFNLVGKVHGLLQWILSFLDCLFLPVVKYNVFSNLNEWFPYKFIVWLLAVKLLNVNISFSVKNLSFCQPLYSLILIFLTLTMRIYLNNKKRKVRNWPTVVLLRSIQTITMD